MVQPQRYGSIREFLDNLPHQPCIWQPENQNICVTCLRINEPVARVCSVWSQALDNAPLEELDFEEEMRSLPAVEKVAEEASCLIYEHELYSDALGKPGSQAESFLGMFRFNLEAILAALGKDESKSK